LSVGTLDQLLDRREQAVGARVRNAREPDPADAAIALLDRDQNDRLLRCAASVLAGGDAPDVALVDLDLAVQLVAPRPHHRPPELVQPCPRCLVGGEFERPPQTERADATLLGC